MVANKSGKMGYILEMPGRPDLAKQRLALAALGVVLSEGLRVFHDKAEKGSTRPRSQLVSRLALLERVSAGCTVVVAAPLCLGVSGKDADWFLAELQARGASVIVNGDLERIEPSGDRSDMVRRVGSAHSVLHVRRSKAKARGEGSGK